MEPVAASAAAPPEAEASAPMQQSVPQEQAQEQAGADLQMRSKLEERRSKVEATSSSADASAPEACEPADGGNSGVQQANPLPAAEVVAATIEDVDLSPPVAPAQPPATLPPVDTLQAEPAPTKVFRMDDDEEEDSSRARGGSSGSGGSYGSTGGSAAAAVVPPGGDVAEDVRRRFQWLCAKDQKTTVKRECQLAAKREEALLAQIQRTIDCYVEALELSQVSERLPDGEGPTLTPEDALKYEERIKFLRGTIAVLEAEHNVSLPKMGAYEATKGLVFSSYAKTATVAKDLGDQTGVSQPITEAATAAATGVRGALSSFTERIGGGFNNERFGGSFHSGPSSNSPLATVGDDPPPAESVDAFLGSAASKHSESTAA